MGAAACALLGAGLTEQLFVPAQKCFLACRVRDGCREVTRMKACGICVCVRVASSDAQKAILYFIHIHQVYYETHFFANLKKKEILGCYFCLFLNQTK